MEQCFPFSPARVAATEAQNPAAPVTLFTVASVHLITMPVTLPLTMDAAAMMVPQQRSEAQRVTTTSELDDIDALVAQYWPRIFRYVSFSIHDEDLAHSITQDTFLKAFNGRASFRGDCAISTWLITIANNLIRDQLRVKKFLFWRKVQATALDAQEMASFLPSGESSPERRILAQERTGQVMAALETLSVNQRRVFSLRFFEGLSLEEISESTSMPVNTVKTHLHRGVTAIRSRLGGAL